MYSLEIEGGCSLFGEIDISGSKNSALPLIASTILAKNKICISNVPDVADIKTLIRLLTMLGGEASFSENTLYIDTSNLSKTKAVYDIVRTMRASILVLAPLLARFGYCEVSLPGGCAIGSRPVDLHLKALQKMGAEITIEEGYIKAKAPKGLLGTEITFKKKTVTGTENIVMAASLAQGTTILKNCATEPEVMQLCEVLQSAGVEIEGIGTETLKIVGSCGKLLNFPDIEVIPDRIEAGTYLCVGAITNSEITINRVNPNHLSSVLEKFQEMGFRLDTQTNSITIFPNYNIQPVQIVTAEYPLFPTDMQAQFVALATQANGISQVEERLFENRFMHVNELQRLGAKIEIEKNRVYIYGKSNLNGADVMATDLRASSALVLAGLVARGKTKVHRIYHLDRGYEKLEEKLTALGAKVRRVQN
ncbi:MAG TPA: UDP-N-acetylglucosamine 1-carboxyvinyltransferase [Campylobacterales bacterium]|nr:UDP-N-acetylglucosamine 1-carboxyvinyltransferase [Campylobacterales bacterium]